VGGFMGVNDKLLLKMRRHPVPNDVTMNELDRFLRSRGFVLHSQDSAHLNYKHKGLFYILTIDAHSMKEQVKAIYIRKILSALDELEN
jgi:predicted RNA binding protein YcfA (HicA-like mRNA interferase family)